MKTKYEIDRSSSKSSQFNIMKCSGFGFGHRRECIARTKTKEHAVEIINALNGYVRPKQSLLGKIFG